MADAAQALQQAYELIEDGDLSAARQLLEDIRPENENNPDFWWVYAHAIEDVEQGKQAVLRVRQLAPNYPGLVELTEEAGLPAPQPIQSLQTAGMPPPPPSLPMDGEIDFDDDLSDDFDTMDESGGGLRNTLVAIGGFLLLIVILIGILWVSGIFDGGAPEPTEIAQATDIPPDSAPTLTVVEDEPTAEAQAATEEPATDVMETDQPPTVEPTEIVSGDPFADLYDDLAPFGVPVDGIRETETALGNTLTIQTCTSPGPAANQSIIGILDAFDSQDVAVPDGVEAFAFEITDCEADRIALTLGIGAELVQGYLDGDTEIADILRGLRRIS